MRKLLLVLLLCSCLPLRLAGQAAGSLPGGAGGGAVTAPAFAFFLGNNCPVANTPTCFYTPANVQVDNTTQWTTSNGNITTTDSPFVSGDVGKYAWGYGTNNIAPYVGGCNPYIAQPAPFFITTTHTTITTFTDGNHIAVGATPGGGGTPGAGGGCFIWGTPDDTGATQLWTAVNAAKQCPRVIVQSSYYLFTSPPEFLWDNPAACKNLPTTYPNTPGAANMSMAMGYVVEGMGPGTTAFFFPPDNPETGSCNHGRNSNSCLAVALEGTFRNFSVLGGGAKGGLPSNAFMLNVDVSLLENFSCAGVGNGAVTGQVGSGGTGGIQITFWAQLQQVNLSACGTEAIDVAPNTGSNTVPVSTGTRVYLDNFGSFGFFLEQGSSFTCLLCEPAGSVNPTGVPVAYWNAGGELYLIGDAATQMNQASSVFDSYVCVSHPCILHASHIQLGSGTLDANTTGISCAVQCTNYLSDVKLVGSGTGTIYTDGNAASQMWDLGGNSFTGGGSVVITGSWFGTASFPPTTSAATNFGTALASQSVDTIAPTGPTSVNLNVIQTTLGVGCGAGSNTVTPTISWTGPGGTAETQALTALSISANGALDSFQNDSATISAKPGTTISYTTASVLASAGCSTTPQYKVFAKVTQ